MSPGPQEGDTADRIWGRTGEGEKPGAVGAKLVQIQGVLPIPKVSGRVDSGLGQQKSNEELVPDRLGIGSC